MSNPGLPSADDFSSGLGAAPQPQAPKPPNPAQPYSGALPNADDFLKPAPGFFDTMLGQNPQVENIIQNNSIPSPAQIGVSGLHGFVSGFSDAWGQGPVIPEDTEKALQKYGWLKDYTAAHTNMTVSFNDAILRPALSAGYTALRTGQAVIGGAEQGSYEAGKALGLPEEAAATIPQIIEYETSRGDLALDHRILPDQAKRMGTVGPITPDAEARYFGTADTADHAEPAAEALAAQQERQATVQAAEVPPAQDIHSVARTIAPETFQEYDALMAQRDRLRQQVSDLGQQRPETDEAKTAQAKIDDILGKVNGVEDRLTNAATARLEDARDELDSALRSDTPEMADIRKQLLATDYRMRDLSPDVASAYRQAQDRMPAEETRPVEQPVPEETTAQAQPQIVPTEAVQGEATGQAPNVAGTETLGAPVQPVANIASDVQRKLVAAGRPEEEASAAAAIVQSHYETRAQRFGGFKGTAQEMYARDAPNIKGAGQRRALEMAQGKTLHQDTIKLYRGTGPAAKVSDLGGMFLSPDRSIAEMYAGENGKITEHSVGFKNLLRSKNWIEAKKSLGLPASSTMKELISGAKDKGYDGITFKTTNGTEYIHIPDARSLEQGKRGSISLGEARNTIKLFKNADASTFMHETAHHWLEELMSDASDAQAPNELKADAATVREWLGTKGGEEIPTKAHEKFARGFERYLMEGVAPSKQLASVFAKFKDWLTQIYQTVQRLKSPITEDIRQVFDRLLSANPERTVIAPERSVEANMADIHEAEAEHTPPDRATSVANNIRSEIDTQTRRVAPEVHNELPGRNEAGGISRENENPPSRGNETAAARESASLETSGAQSGGGNKTEAKGFGSAEYESALNDVKLSRNKARAPSSLFDAIRHLGGIKIADVAGKPIVEAGDVLTALKDYKNPRGVKRIINNETGMTPDYLREALTEQGWLGRGDRDVGATDINELLEAITSEAQGGKIFHPEDQAAHEIEARKALDEELTRAGVTSTDSPNFAATKLANWRASEDARNFADEQEMAAYEELSRLEPEQYEELVSHGYEPGSDIGAESDADQHNGSASGVNPQPEAAENAAGSSSATAGTEAQGKPSDPDANTGQPRTPAVDKAGNIRLENINMTEDARAVVRQLAANNMDFNNARFGEASYALYRQIKAAGQLLVETANAAVEASQKWMESGSDTDAVAYAQASQRALIAAEVRAELTAGWGRAGHAFQKVDRLATGEDPMGYIRRTTGKTLEELKEEGRLLNQLDTPDQKTKFLADSRLSAIAKAKSGILSYFINNLISGPITHAGYSVGNTVWALTKAVPTTLVGATLDTLRGAEGADRIHYGEVQSQLYSMVRGFRDAIPSAWSAAQTGIPFMKGAAELDKLEGGPGLGLVGNESLRPQSIFPNSGPVLKTTGYVLETPSRTVSAIHTLFYGMGYEQEIARRAYRSAMAKGLEGDRFNTEVARFTANPPEADIGAAHEEALKMVLMKRPAFDTSLGQLSRAVNNNFLAKLIMPFMQVGANILREGLVEHTPFGLMSQDVRDNLSGKNGDTARSTQYAKIIVGSGVAVSVVGLASEGLISGSGPVDPKERATLMRTGWKPYSIRMGEFYVPYRKYLGPLGPLVAGSADMYEIGYTAADEGYTKAAEATVLGFAEVVADESWMSGVSNFINAIKNWDTDGERYIRGLATDFIPFSVGMRQMATLVDPYAREQRTLVESARANIPYLSQQDMPRRDVWGEPIQSHTSLGPSQAVDDPVDQEWLKIGKEYPATPRRDIRGVKLTDQQYDDLTRIGGRYAKMLLEHDIAMPGWDQNDPETKLQIMKLDVQTARESARNAIMAADPTIWQRATAIKMGQLQKSDQ